MIETLFVFALLACETTAPEAPAPAPEEAAQKAPEPAPEPAVERRVFFVSPEDGATVTSPVKVVFGVEGMKVVPAGEIVEGTGHHHLLIDTEGGVPAGTVVPADETHIHFGGGQTETEVELSPGGHTLTLQFADGAHASYGPSMTSTIHVTVAE